MASNTPKCHLCHKAMEDDEASIKHHLSSFHVKYFPYSCTTCDESIHKDGSIHKEATEEAMEDHIATSHSENNSGYYVGKKTEEDKEKETELKIAIAQCRRLWALQVTSNNTTNALHQQPNFVHNGTNGNENDIGNEQIPNDSKAHLRQVSISEHSISAVDTAIESGPIQPQDDESLDNIAAQQHYAVNSPENVMQINSLIPPVVVKTEQIVVDPTPNSQNNSTNATLTKPEPPETVSTVPVRLRLEAALSSFVPIDIEANDEPQNFSNSTKETNFLNQSTSHKKRRLPNNIPNDPSKPKRKQMVNGNQVASGNHSSHETDHNSATSGNQDTNDINAAMSHRNEGPTTSAQITSNAPADTSKTEIITKLFVVISVGTVSFETIDRRKYNYAPLSDHLKILRESVLSTNGCEVVMHFYPSDRFRTHLDSPSRYRKYCHAGKYGVISLERLKIFADQIHSIAFLWTNFPVTAHFGHYRKGSDEMPSQSDYCSELFSRERSIFKCKKLAITLENYWPISIVTNVANDCNECKLDLTQFTSNEFTQTDYQIHEEFLEELYEGDVLQRVDVTFKFFSNKEAANDFLNKLKERFVHNPHKRFKFVVITQSTNVRKLFLQIQDSTLEAKTLPHTRGDVVIEQRATHS